MIVSEITKKIAEAMKARDEIRLSTLRMLSSALNYEKISKMHDLSEDEELVVVQKEVKKRKDAIEALRQAQGKHTTSSQDEVNNRISKEEKELEILMEYLPKQMSDDELTQIITETINQVGASNMNDMGKVIGAVKSKVGMKAEGSKISQFVKEKLS